MSGSNGIPTDDVDPDILTELTSTNDTQSILWVGTFHDVEISKITRFGNDDVYFTTVVTLENTGLNTLKNLYYLRTVDPDQEKEYYNTYRTLNYVKYQPAAADGSDCCLPNGYVNPSSPTMSLVCAVGINNKDFFLGIGSTHPNIRVSHHGYLMLDPVAGHGDGSRNTDWHDYGGNDMEPVDDYVSRMKSGDQSIHLTYKIDSLGPGETVQFSFAHVLAESDLTAAMEAITTITFVQPTGIMSGHTTVVVVLNNHTATECVFSLYGIKIAVSASPDWYVVGTDSPGSQKSTFSVVFNSADFADGRVQLHAKTIDAMNVSQAFQQNKAAVVSNTGTVMVYVEDDLGGTYPLSNTAPTHLSLTKHDPLDDDPVFVSFFLEMFSGGLVTSILIDRVGNYPSIRNTG
jgi:hypothetical protein